LDAVLAFSEETTVRVIVESVRYDVY